MKFFIELLVIAILVSIFSGCRMDPDALLGGHEDNYYQSSQSSPAVQSGAAECTWVLKEYSSSDSASCGLGSPLSKILPSIMRINEGKIRVSLKKATDGKFPTVTSVEYRRLSTGTPELRDLKCTQVQPPSTGEIQLTDCLLEKHPNDDVVTRFAIYTLILTHESCSVN